MVMKFFILIFNLLIRRYWLLSIIYLIKIRLNKSIARLKRYTQSFKIKDIA